jgi:hypothetical protein
MFPPSGHVVYRCVVSKSIIHRWKGLNLNLTSFIKDKLNFYTSQKSVEISKVKNMKKSKYYFSMSPKSKMWEEETSILCADVWVGPAHAHQLPWTRSHQFCHLWRHQLRFHLLVWKIGHKRWQQHKTTQTVWIQRYDPRSSSIFIGNNLQPASKVFIHPSRTQERNWTNKRWNRTNNTIYIHWALNYSWFPLRPTLQPSLYILRSIWWKQTTSIHCVHSSIEPSKGET